MYNLTQISEILGCPLRAGRLATAGTQPRAIAQLLTDSRSLTTAEQTLFFALVTAKGDGHRYVAQLYQQGVRAFVVSRQPEEWRGSCPEAWFLIVPDTLDALQRLAAHHRSRFDCPVVGITGSNGKTTVKEWLYQMLGPTRDVVRSPRSYNSQVGVPLSVWQLHEGCGLALFEAGISQTGEMERLERVIRPTVGILTNIGTAHAEGFVSMQQKLGEKLLLFRGCDVIIYNADIPGIGEALELAGVGARSLSWTRHRAEAQIEVLSTSQTATSTTIRYLCLGLDGEFTIPMVGEAAVEDAMSCLGLMVYLGCSRDEIAARMQCLTPLAMRLEVVEGVRGCLIINDAYNADLTSLEVALDFQRRRLTSRQRPTLILSDLIGAGLAPGVYCREVARLARLYGLTRLVAVGERWCASEATMRDVLGREAPDCRAGFYPTTDALLAPGSVLSAMQDELVLIKGARAFCFERVSGALQSRRHETVLEVSLDAIVHNLGQYRRRLRPETRLTCMVKAFGYGTGSYELAKTLQDQRVDCLAVAVADEGADLRRQGIHTPIIVMNPELGAFRLIIEHRLEPEIYSFRLLEAFVAECRSLGVVRYPVHIKIDSGMHRLGFLPDEVDRLVGVLQRTGEVMVRSVFSHFATADDPAQADFVHEQKRRFDLCADRLRAAFPYPILRHICNSAGIEVYPQYQMEMCRLGIGLYGFEASSADLGLCPVATLTSTLLQVKDVPASETVGYMRAGRLTRPSRIAMVPIGYADGYDRRLGGGRAEMVVRGHRCPTVGNVCMDVTFIDVTDYPDIAEGDAVEVFGPQMPITELADRLGTIVYEVLSTVSARVRRVYYKE